MPIVNESQLYANPDSVRPFFGWTPSLPQAEPGIMSRAVSFFSEYGPSPLNIRGAANWLSRFFDPSETGFDPYKNIPKGYESMASAFAFARGEEDMAIIQSLIEDHMENQRVLEGMPFYQALPMGVATAMTDPLNWLIPGHWIFNAVKKEGVTRILPTMLRAGVAGGIANLPTELMLQTSNPIRTWQESMADTVSAGIFTALLGGYWGRKSKRLDVEVAQARASVTRDLKSDMDKWYDWDMYDRLDPNYYASLREQFADEIWGAEEEGMPYQSGRGNRGRTPSRAIPGEEAAYPEGEWERMLAAAEEGDIQELTRMTRTSYLRSHFPEWFRSLVDDEGILELRSWLFGRARQALAMEEIEGGIKGFGEEGAFYERWGFKLVTPLAKMMKGKARAAAEFLGRLLPEGNLRNLPQVYSQEFADFINQVMLHPQFQRLTKTIFELEDKLDELIHRYQVMFQPGMGLPIPPTTKATLTAQIKATGKKIRSLRRELRDVLNAMDIPNRDPYMMEYVKVSRMGMEYYVPRYLLFDEWKFYTATHGNTDLFAPSSMGREGKAVHEPVSKRVSEGEEAAPTPPPKTKWVEPDSEGPPPNPAPLGKKAPEGEEGGTLPLRPPEAKTESPHIDPDVTSMTRAPDVGNADEMREILKSESSVIGIAGKDEPIQLNPHQDNAAAIRFRSGLTVFARSEVLPHWMMKDALSWVRISQKELDDAVMGIVDREGNFTEIGQIHPVYDRPGVLEEISEEGPKTIPLKPGEEIVQNRSYKTKMDKITDFVKHFISTYGLEYGQFPSQYIITRDLFEQPSLIQSMKKPVLQEMISLLKNHAHTVGIKMDDVRLVTVADPLLNPDDPRAMHQIIEFGPIAIDPFARIADPQGPIVQSGFQPMRLWKSFLEPLASNWGEWSPRVAELHEELLKDLDTETKLLIENTPPLSRVIKESELDSPVGPNSSFYDPPDNSIFFQRSGFDPQTRATWLHEYGHYSDYISLSHRGKGALKKWRNKIIRNSQDDPTISIQGMPISGFRTISGLSADAVFKDEGIIRSGTVTFGKEELGKQARVLAYLDLVKADEAAAWNTVNALWENARALNPEGPEALAGIRSSQEDLDWVLKVTGGKTAGVFCTLRGIKDGDPNLFIRGFGNLCANLRDAKSIEPGMAEEASGCLADYFGAISVNTMGQGHSNSYYAQGTHAVFVRRSAVTGKDILDEHPFVTTARTTEAFADLLGFRSINPESSDGNLLLRQIAELGMKTFTPSTYKYMNHLIKSIAQDMPPIPYYKFEPES